MCLNYAATNAHDCVTLYLCGPEKGKKEENTYLYEDLKLTGLVPPQNALMSITTVKLGDPMLLMHSSSRLFPERSRGLALTAPLVGLPLESAR